MTKAELDEFARNLEHLCQQTSNFTWVYGVRKVIQLAREAILAREEEEGNLLTPLDSAGAAGCGGGSDDRNWP